MQDLVGCMVTAQCRGQTSGSFIHAQGRIIYLFIMVGHAVFDTAPSAVDMGMYLSHVLEPFATTSLHLFGPGGSFNPAMCLSTTSLSYKLPCDLGHNACGMSLVSTRG